MSVDAILEEALRRREAGQEHMFLIHQHQEHRLLSVVSIYDVVGLVVKHYVHPEDGKTDSIIMVLVEDIIKKHEEK